MLQKIKKRKEEQGFTIIEVLIVLAIAGLILLIVFLAVPALQRNSRNTQRKSDVSNLLAAVNEYVSNNGGTLPAALNVNGNSATFCDATPCGTAAAATAKIGFYTSANAVLKTTFTTAPAAVADQVWVEEGATCTNATTIATSTSTRSVAALYAIETGSGLAWQCQSS